MKKVVIMLEGRVSDRIGEALRKSKIFISPPEFQVRVSKKNSLRSREMVFKPTKVGVRDE